MSWRLGLLVCWLIAGRNEPPSKEEVLFLRLKEGRFIIMCVNLLLTILEFYMLLAAYLIVSI